MCEFWNIHVYGRTNIAESFEEPVDTFRREWSSKPVASTAERNFLAAPKPVTLIARNGRDFMEREEKLIFTPMFEAHGEWLALAKFRTRSRFSRARSFHAGHPV